MQDLFRMLLGDARGWGALVELMKRLREAGHEVEVTRWLAEAIRNDPNLNTRLLARLSESLGERVHTDDMPVDTEPWEDFISRLMSQDKPQAALSLAHQSRSLIRYTREGDILGLWELREHVELDATILDDLVKFRGEKLEGGVDPDLDALLRAHGRL